MYFSSKFPFWNMNTIYATTCNTIAFIFPDSFLGLLFSCSITLMDIYNNAPLLMWHAHSRWLLKYLDRLLHLYFLNTLQLFLVSRWYSKWTVTEKFSVQILWILISLQRWRCLLLWIELKYSGICGRNKDFFKCIFRPKRRFLIYRPIKRTTPWRLDLGSKNLL